MDIVKERERVAEMCASCDIDSYVKPGGAREYVAHVVQRNRREGRWVR